MGRLTDKPWGVNVAQHFVRDLDGLFDFIVAGEVGLVTMSAGDPAVLASRLKDAGITVFHVVPSVRGAEKGVAAGVDGVVVEGIEGGGFKSVDGASSLVLVPEIATRFPDLPIIAAGGFVDGRSMAAAFAMGADGVQMGTRMVASVESPIHDNSTGGPRRQGDRHRPRQPPLPACHADVEDGERACSSACSARSPRSGREACGSTMRPLWRR